MNNINILFSSVGRRVELVKYFREAKEKLNINGNLIGIDIDELAPALNFVDRKYIVPRLNNKDFIPTIIDICKKESISLIVPTIDTELEIYAKNKKLIEKETGTKVMVCDEDIISIIRDKIKTNSYLKLNGFDVPRVITEKDIKNKNYSFPLFIKPLDGSSSINAFKIENFDELMFFKSYVPNPIIQEFVDGTEYCVDVFSDLDSNIITVVPKLRLAHRSGEITKAKIIKDREIIELGKKLAKTLNAQGEINFDCIKTDNGIKIIEINARFAGGAPISFKSGANSAEKIYRCLLGEKIEYNEEYKDGLIALRFDDAIFLNA